MDITQTTEESLLRLKDDLIADIKKIKRKIPEEKGVICSKNVSENRICCWDRYGRVVFSTGDRDCSIRRGRCVSRRRTKYGAKYPWF